MESGNTGNFWEKAPLVECPYRVMDGTRVFCRLYPAKPLPQRVCLTYEDSVNDCAAKATMGTYRPIFSERARQRMDEQGHVGLDPMKD